MSRKVYNNFWLETDPCGVCTNKCDGIELMNPVTQICCECLRDMCKQNGFVEYKVIDENLKFEIRDLKNQKHKLIRRLKDAEEAINKEGQTVS